jgi:hypothetical protein
MRRVPQDGLFPPVKSLEELGAEDVPSLDNETLRDLIELRAGETADC